MTVPRKAIRKRSAPAKAKPRAATAADAMGRVAGALLFDPKRDLRAELESHGIAGLIADYPAMRSAFEVIERLLKTHPQFAQTRDALQLLVEHGPPSIPDAIGELLDRGEELFLERRPNTLSVVGGLVDRAVRRAILLAMLRNSGFHLAYVADALHFSDVPSLVREIKRTGLADHPEFVKARGETAHRSGHKPRPAKR